MLNSNINIIKQFEVIFFSPISTCRATVLGDQNICSYYVDFIICELDLIQIYIDSKIETIELVHDTRFFISSDPYCIHILFQPTNEYTH